MSDITELEKGMDMTKKEYEARKERDPPIILRDFLFNSEEKIRKLKADAKLAQVGCEENLCEGEIQVNQGQVYFVFNFIETKRFLLAPHRYHLIPPHHPVTYPLVSPNPQCPKPHACSFCYELVPWYYDGRQWQLWSLPAYVQLFDRPIRQRPVRRQHPRRHCQDRHRRDLFCHVPPCSDLRSLGS